MTTPQDNNPGNEPEVTPVAPIEPANTTAAPNPAKSTDWETSYKGLQVTYNKLFEDHRKDSNLLLEKGADIEKQKQEIDRLTKELEKATGNLSEKEKALLTKDSDLASKDKAHARLKLIATKFPSLIALEDQGLLPETPSIEDLEGKLTALHNAISQQIDAKAIAQINQVPPGTQKINNVPGPQSLDELQNRLTQLAGSKKPEDQAEYERLFKLMLDLDSKK